LIDMSAYDMYNTGKMTNFEVTDEYIAQNIAKLEKLV